MTNPLKKIGSFLGAGFRTGAADNDPSGLYAYTVTGAQTGFSLLWVMVFVIPLMSAIQEMSAHIGALSGAGLTGNIKRHYPKWLLAITALSIIIANTFNIGADIAGMSGAMALLLPSISEQILAVILSVLIIFITIRFSYRQIAVTLNWLALSLFAYVVAFLLASHNVPNVWHQLISNALIPQLPRTKEALIILFALLGTSISPYLYFWQANEEAEQTKALEHHVKVRHRSVKARLNLIDMDTRFGMIFSNFISLFIISLAATTFFQGGVQNIATLRQAAEMLQPLAGNYAFMIFTLGILSAGLLSIPVLAGSAAYVLSEVFNWQGSLDKKFHQAKQFYIVLAVSVLLGLSMSFIGLSPVTALFYSALINAVASPLLIMVIIHMAHNRKVVGENRVHPLLASIGYLAFFIMTVGTIFFLATS